MLDDAYPPPPVFPPIVLGLHPEPPMAPWHERGQGRRKHLCSTAMGAARVAAPHLGDTLVDFLIPWMPRVPLASPNIRSISRDHWSDPTLLDDAVTQPWVSFDAEQGVACRVVQNCTLAKR